MLWDIRLQIATYWLEIRVPKTTDCRPNQSCTGSLGAKEIYNDQKLHTRGGKPAIGSQSFVDGVKEAEILVNGGLLPPDLKDIEAGIEQEREFNHRIGIRWEQSDMKGVVLWPPVNTVLAMQLTSGEIAQAYDVQLSQSPQCRLFWDQPSCKLNLHPVP